MKGASQQQTIAAFRLISSSDPSAVILDKTSKYSKCWMNKFGHDNPTVVLRPKTLPQLQAFLSFANRNEIPLVPQSGNTGLVGGSVPNAPDEHVLSMDRFTATPICLNKEEQIMTLDAGVVLQDAIDFAKQHNFLFPLSIGSSGSCLIGGNVATNAGGMYFSRFGSLRENVVGLEAVLPSGEILNMMKCVLPKDSVGFDLRSLFIGSEGTLGVISKVAVKVHTMPTSRELAILACDSFDNVRKINEKISQLSPGLVSAVELMDSSVLEMVRARLGKTICFDITKGHYYIALEFMGFDEMSDRAQLEALLASALDEGYICDGIIAQSLTHLNEIWATRESCGPAVNSYKRNWKYDLSLPLKDWEAVVAHVQEKVEKHNGRLAVWGHLGDRNIHMNVVCDDENCVDLGQLIEENLITLTLDLGGSISAEHGVGLAKQKYVKAALGEAVVAKMNLIRECFDPCGILNRGKLV